MPLLHLKVKLSSKTFLFPLFHIVIVKVLSVLECSRLPHISLLVYNGLCCKKIAIFEVLMLSLTLGDDGYHIGPLLMLVSSIAFDTLPNSIQGTSIGINMSNLEMKVDIQKKVFPHEHLEGS